MNVPAFVLGLLLSGVVGGFMALVIADAHAHHYTYRWTFSGLLLMWLVGSSLGWLVFYALGHVTVLCDLRSWQAAHGCTVVWL